MAPLFYLIARAIELTLEAYLLSQGATKNKLLKINHHLDRAPDSARHHGLRTTRESFDCLVALIAPLHAEHWFRYRQVGYFKLPNPQEAIEIVEPLLQEVERVIRAEALSAIGAGR